MKFLWVDNEDMGLKFICIYFYVFFKIMFYILYCIYFRCKNIWGEMIKIRLLFDEFIFLEEYFSLVKCIGMIFVS